MIREATPEDAPSLAEVMRNAYEPYLQRVDSLPPLDVDYAEEIANHPVWVTEGGGLIMHFGKEASISNIAVDPAFQGQGIGKGLLAFAEAEALRRGYHTLQLATHVLLSENVALYQHLGWQETGRDELRVYMEKRLRFPYRFDKRWAGLFAALGVKKTDGVQVTDTELIATFGRYKVRTPLANIKSAAVDGPHRWYTAVGLRLSFTDDGITFGTNNKRGVTVQFHEKIPKVIVRDGHSSLWVSVEDPEGLVGAIDAYLGA